MTKLIEFKRYDTDSIDMSPEEFRALGYQAVDHIADLFGNLRELPVAAPTGQRTLLDRAMPEIGRAPDQLIHDAASLLFRHSTFNGHARFWGYITSSAAPMGAIGDLLAAAVNANVSSAQLAPVATEIEQQTIRWIAELIGYPGTGGILLSGGNMANISALWAARRAKVGEDVRKHGLDTQKLLVYGSREVHTWLEKAADLSGIGTNAIRYMPINERGQLNVNVLREHIDRDFHDGYLPLMAIGNAGTTSTGAIDPLSEIAEISREFDMWFHVDGAYGAFAAMLPEYTALRDGMAQADSVALDPHKWLYAPLEAGCLLVRDPQHLKDTFSYHPDYYHFEDGGEELPPNYYEHGPQNSRGFRALKIWLALQHIGRQGYQDLLHKDIALTQALCAEIAARPTFEIFTLNLSIVTFRYVPQGIDATDKNCEAYLNALNEALLDRIQNSGEFFISNAVLDDRFVLRTCIVNFRTTLEDVQAFAKYTAACGIELDSQMRPEHLQIEGVIQ